MVEKGRKKTPAKKLSFGEAVSEVEDILESLESETVDIDTLGEEVKRAVELIQICRQKLEKTEGEVRDLVAGLETGANDQADPETKDLPF